MIVNKISGVLEATFPRMKKFNIRTYIPRINERDKSVLPIIPNSNIGFFENNCISFSEIRLKNAIGILFNPILPKFDFLTSRG